MIITTKQRKASLYINGKDVIVGKGKQVNVSGEKEIKSLKSNPMYKSGLIYELKPIATSETVESTKQTGLETLVKASSAQKKRDILINEYGQDKASLRNMTEIEAVATKVGVKFIKE